jgi:hypothetical protein
VQPPSVDGVVWFHHGKISGGNRTARKRCQFFTGPQEERKCCRFSPGHGYPVQKEAAIAQGARGPRHRWSLAASTKDEDPPNNTGMAKLRQNMSVPGTMAARFIDWAQKEKAVPGWGGNRAYCRACVEAITRAPDPLATAL